MLSSKLEKFTAGIVFNSLMVVAVASTVKIVEKLSANSSAARADPWGWFLLLQRSRDGTNDEEIVFACSKCTSTMPISSKLVHGMITSCRSTSPSITIWRWIHLSFSYLLYVVMFLSFYCKSNLLFAAKLSEIIESTICVEIDKESRMKLLMWRMDADAVYNHTIIWEMLLHFISYTNYSS